MNDLVHEMALAVLDELVYIAADRENAAPHDELPSYDWPDVLERRTWFQLSVIVDRVAHRDPDLNDRWAVATGGLKSALPYHGLRARLRQLAELGYVRTRFESSLPANALALALPLDVTGIEAAAQTHVAADLHASLALGIFRRDGW